MQNAAKQFELMKLAAIIFFFVFITACNSSTDSDNIASTDSSFKTGVPEIAVIDAEKYVGTLPCADCEGIDVSLQLNKDSSYIMNSVYKGNKVDSSNNHIEDTGKWNMHGNDTLYLSTNNQSTKYIKKGSTLTQLDGNGKVITGPLAAMFVLHKK